jgi:hypothetical protein
MTTEDFKKELSLLDKEHQEKTISLCKRYVLSIAKFKKGDIIADHSTIILVDEIEFIRFDIIPTVVYKGIELTKKLIPKKSGIKASVFGNNAKHFN